MWNFFNLFWKNTFILVVSGILRRLYLPPYLFATNAFQAFPSEGKVPSMTRRMRWNALLLFTIQADNRSIHPANKEKTADFLRLLCRLHLISRLTAPASPSREALNGVKPKAN